MNEEDYPNFEGDHDIPNFDDESSPAPMGSEGPQNDYSLSSQAKGDTVYKKAPGAPKRFKSSYVHFFTDFVERAKKQLGPDGLVSVWFCHHIIFQDRSALMEIWLFLSFAIAAIEI